MPVKKILAIVEDLFFTVKINETAKRSGLGVEFVKSTQDVLDKAQENPALIILDLNFQAVEPVKLVETLKASEGTKGIDVVGYLSHVQGDLKLQAQKAGCDMVLPKSSFSQNLPQILKRHA